VPATLSDPPPSAAPGDQTGVDASIESVKRVIFPRHGLR